MSIESFDKYKILIGKRLRALRLSRGLTQLDLAVKCDFEKTTISRIENGRSNVTIKTLYILSCALNLETFKLLSVQELEED